MNEQFIQRIKIDWNEVEEDSYLREIETIRSMDTLEFQKPIVFFVGRKRRRQVHIVGGYCGGVRIQP